MKEKKKKGILEDLDIHARSQVYDPSETRILVTHASPGREGLLAQLALVLKVREKERKDSFRKRPLAHVSHYFFRHVRSISLYPPVYILDMAFHTTNFPVSQTKNTTVIAYLSLSKAFCSYGNRFEIKLRVL